MTTVLLVNKHFAVSVHLLFVVPKCQLGGTFTDNHRKNEAHKERQTRSSIISTTYNELNTFISNIISFSLRQYPHLFCSLFCLFSNFIKRIYVFSGLKVNDNISLEYNDNTHIISVGLPIHSTSIATSAQHQNNNTVLYLVET